MKRLKLEGHKFGRLTVISYAFNKRGVYWLCRCDCGQSKIIRGDHISFGKTTSCGCFHKEKHTTHGMTHSAEYHAWDHMIQRCTNPKCKAWKHYGGRGIKVCDRWMGSFENFLKDVGIRPNKDLSIDRIDNDGNYEPSNCRWATKLQQSNNRRAYALN